MLFRILTENINQPGIENKVNGFFDGYTILKADGYWKTAREKSIIIEIIAEPEARKKVFKLAQEIKRLNNQQSVLVQEFGLNSSFV